MTCAAERIKEVRATYDKTLFDARVKGVVTPPPSWSDVGYLLSALDEATNSFSEVTNKVREIHQVMKRGEATKDHGLDGNLACILDHACSKNDPEPL